jgi:hypothetical protein
MSLDTTIEKGFELPPEERTRCEVWTRVMGYHRPVPSFNIGKQGEHLERRFFQESRTGLEQACVEQQPG